MLTETCGLIFPLHVAGTRVSSSFHQSRIQRLARLQSGFQKTNYRRYILPLLDAALTRRTCGHVAVTSLTVTTRTRGAGAPLLSPDTTPLSCTTWTRTQAPAHVTRSLETNVVLARGAMGHLSCRARAGGQPGDEAGGDGGPGELGRESDGQGKQALDSAVLHQG